MKYVWDILRFVQESFNGYFESQFYQKQTPLQVQHFVYLLVNFQG